MGQIRKIGDLYYVEFYARGLLYSQVAGYDKLIAQKMLEEIEIKITQGEALTIVREIDLAAFFEQFLFNAKEEFSAKSIKRFTQTWSHWVNFLTNFYPKILKISDITPSIIESYKTYLAKNVKPKIVNLTILLLREILEYGIKIGFINDNPTLHIRLLEMQKKRIGLAGRRFKLAKDLIPKGVPLGKIYQLLKLNDVAQIMYWSDFIPLKMEDTYQP